MKEEKRRKTFFEKHIVEPIVRQLAAVIGRYHKALKKLLEEIRVELLDEQHRKEAGQVPGSSKEGSEQGRKDAGKDRIRAS